MWPCTRTLLFWELSAEKPWEAETGAVCQCSRDLKDLGVRRKGALRPAPHYRSCQPPSTDIRGPTVRGVLLGAGFSSLEVVNTAQLSLCSFRATVAFFLSSRRLCCCYIAIFPQSKCSLAGIEPRAEAWWQLRPGLSHAACRCEWRSAMLVQRLKVLPPSVECSTGRVGRGASQKGEEERGRRAQREREGGGGRWPLNTAVRKLWLNFQSGQ